MVAQLYGCCAGFSSCSLAGRAWPSVPRRGRAAALVASLSFFAGSRASCEAVARPEGAALEDWSGKMRLPVMGEGCMPGEATTIRMRAAHRRFLEKRGARSHRGGSAFSRSAVVERALEELALYLKWTDPRKTRGFPEAMHMVLVRHLPEPWQLTPHEIETLEGFLRRSSEFLEAIAADGVDPEALLDAIGAMAVPEKVSLVDQAVLAQAPAMADTSPEER